MVTCVRKLTSTCNKPKVYFLLVSHHYGKRNNKYLKNYDKNIESSYIEYLDANNLFGWAMPKKLRARGFKRLDNLSMFTEEFIKNYDENGYKRYILEVDVEYPKKLRSLHSDLPFLPERMKINKCEKLFCNIRNKENYVIHIVSLKQALKHGLILKRVHKVVEFEQAWLKPYIMMNTELCMQEKNDFEKEFFKLMNNAVFGKTMKNVRNHRDNKIVTTDKHRSILASEPNYHSRLIDNGDEKG